MLFFLRFVLRRAFQNMKGNLLPNLTTITIIGISMLIFSSFSLIAFNLTSFLKAWEEKIEVIAYLKRGMGLVEVEGLLKKIRQFEGVEAVKYVSSNEAMAFMEMKLGHQKNLLEGIQPEILPSSFEIRLMKDFRNSNSIKGIVTQLRQLPQVDEIQYGQEWVETFLTLVHLFRITQWVLGGLLLMGIIFITFNTLQLTISSRREEIEIMQILGARPSFIQVPFYVEGLIQGFVGTGLAILFLFYLHYEVLFYKVFFLYLAPSMKEWFSGIPIRFLPPEKITGVILGGTVLGFFGSFAASMRFLKDRV
ncbi:MAG: cell division protein FtsX [Thermodesulfobacteriota bacterium]